MASGPVSQIFLSDAEDSALPPALAALSSTVRQFAGEAYQLYT